MPKIKVRYFAVLRELLGDIKEEEYEIGKRTTLMELLLEHIPQRHPNASSPWKERLFQTERGKITFENDATPSLKGYYLILVNGKPHRSISEDGKHVGLMYTLNDGDEIAILPPVGGG